MRLATCTLGTAATIVTNYHVCVFIPISACLFRWPPAVLSCYRVTVLSADLGVRVTVLPCYRVTVLSADLWVASAVLLCYRLLFWVTSAYTAACSVIQLLIVSYFAMNFGRRSLHVAERQLAPAASQSANILIFLPRAHYVLPPTARLQRAFKSECGLHTPCCDL